VPKILNRIQQGEVVKGDRLDKVNAVSSGVRKLEIIGPAPKFELVNQNNLKVSNETYKGKVYVLEFFFHDLPYNLS
jgi:protein SCO1/2